MRIHRQLAVVLAAATFVGTSAFAESRPSNETRTRGEGNIQRRERSEPRAEGRAESRRSDDSSSTRRSEGRVDRRRVEAPSGSRVEVEGKRNERDRDRRTWAGRAAAHHDGRSDRRDNGNWRGDNRNYGNRGHGYGNRTPYYHRGRVSQVHRYGSGYRVWIAGAPYPYFIPSSYYHRDRFRVGLSIHLGGFYNPLGYYDYYDARYSSRYDNGRSYSDGVLRGVVESVDYRRDTFVIRNEATGSFVTVSSRDRRRDEVRAGDYVEISGDWTRSGYFQAYDVDFLD